MSLTSSGIFRWLREVADSSCVESQEHRTVLENRAQQELPAPDSLLLLLLTQLYREFIFINTLKLSGEGARVDVLPGSLPREGICF